MAKGETYEQFIEKFKAKKTTDDCYTPITIYNIVKDFCISEYGIKEENIIRPFKPNGDYINEDYTNKVVVDNPPFSIFSEIVNYYCDNNIKFFLFCNSLTANFKLFHTKKVQYLNVALNLTYQNGAIVKTAFCTNLHDNDIFIINKPQLKKDIETENNRLVKANKKTIKKIKHHKNIITPALLNKISSVDFNIKYDECCNVRNKDIDGYNSFFGDAFIINDERAQAQAQAQVQAQVQVQAQAQAQVQVQYNLSRSGQLILEYLNNKKVYYENCF